MAASVSPKQLSPKFTWPLIVGLVVFAGGEALSRVTVEMFSWAGAWAGTLHAFITLVAMAATAYYKMDPLRQNFAEQVKAHEAVQQVNLTAAAAAEQAAIAAPSDQAQATGKHVGTPIVYDPPNLAG